VDWRVDGLELPAYTFAKARKDFVQSGRTANAQVIPGGLSAEARTTMHAPLFIASHETVYEERANLPTASGRAFIYN
jgi:hypothetical protein